MGPDFLDHVSEGARTSPALATMPLIRDGTDYDKTLEVTATCLPSQKGASVAPFPVDPRAPEPSGRWGDWVPLQSAC
jgi:hypothetical protein